MEKCKYFFVLHPNPHHRHVVYLRSAAAPCNDGLFEGDSLFVERVVVDFNEGRKEVFEEKLLTLATAELILQTVRKHIYHVALLDIDSKGLKMLFFTYITPHGH